MLKQSETVKYIVAEVGEKAALLNTENITGLTALNVLEYCPKDIKSYEIRDILMESVRTRDGMRNGTQLSVDRKKATARKVWWRKFTRYLEYQGHWIEDTRGTLMTVATLIEATTFQCIVNPPGAFWQQDYTHNKVNGPCDVGEDMCETGIAIIGYYDDTMFPTFLISNGVAFTGSIVVIFLIIGGFPLQNKFCTWFMTVIMSTTIVFTGFNYFLSIQQIVPDRILVRMDWSSIASAWIFVWFGMSVLVSLIHIMRFSDLGEKEVQKMAKESFH